MSKRHKARVQEEVKEGKGKVKGSHGGRGQEGTEGEGKGRRLLLKERQRNERQCYV